MDGECRLTMPGTDSGVEDATTPIDQGTLDSGESCETAVFCGTPPTCCESGTECVQDQCLAVCESGVRCGADRTECCASTEVCIDAACVAPGDECVDSFECPIGNFCEPTLGQCLPQFDPITCATEPEFGPFETLVEWEATASTERSDCFHPISTPIVVDLDGDGVPELLANMACNESWNRGALRAFAGDTGAEVWVSDVETHGRISVGAADLRGDGNVVIVTITSPERSDGRRAVAFDADGNELWRSTNEMGAAQPVGGDNGAPTFADLDGDGVSEIIFGALVLDADGVLVWSEDSGANEGTNSSYSGGISAVADIDVDGFPDVVAGRNVYERDGTFKWIAGNDSPIPDGYPAIAQFDDDPQAEVVLVASGQVYLIDGISGELEYPAVSIEGGGRGGPPTVADFDGDGRPEIGVAGGASYMVIDPDGGEEDEMVVLWSRPTVDESSNATGSSVFDFQGDGVAEVVYQEECNLYVYAGPDGEVLLEIENSSATIHEYPIVVDVDADGNSELVVVANNRSVPAGCASTYPGWDGSRRGVFVYGDAADRWVRTRRVWNQHAYHVTNVDAAGGVPMSELNNWEVPGLNNYRQNVQGDGAFNAPDLQVGLEVVLDGCPNMATLRARVRNEGNLGVPAGVEVAFYEGTEAMPEMLLGTAATTVPLLPGASTVVELEIMLDGFGPFDYLAIVDHDDEAMSAIEECLEDNNNATLTGVECALLL